jgi:hypothetical protein
MNTIEHVRASVTDDNIVQLDVKLNVCEINKNSFLGSYKVLQEALTQSMFNQIKEGKQDEARNTLEEICKLWFWQALGVNQGNIEIKKGVLYGFDNEVEIDDSLKRRIDGAKLFMKLNGMAGVENEN